MDIAFRVRNVEVPPTLRRVTLAKVTRLATQCGSERAEVCFSEERNPRIAEREVCEITLFGPGRILRAQATATDVAVAADRVIGKLEQRADRLRGRLMGRRYRRGYVPAARPSPLHGGSVHFPANRSRSRRDPGVVDPFVHGAGEVADMGIDDSKAKPMTPEEAALEMGEQGSDIFFFLNAETDRLAVVYRRRDRDIAVDAVDAVGAVAALGAVAAGATSRAPADLRS